MINNTNGIIERKARIFNIQKYNMYDGPGVRTIVFFQGCPLRCKWCANPEGMLRKNRVMLKSNLCKNHGACTEVCPVGIHTINSLTNKHEINRDIDCLGCRKCEDVCTQSAIEIMGEEKTISELLQVIEEDRTFYEMSGGGVTLGGGEVLMQPEAARNLLMACKNSGINTAIETSGYATTENILKVAEYTDLFLFDIKHMNSDEHLKWTGVRNEQILENLKTLLQNKYNVHIRMPLLKGVNDGEDTIRKTMEFLAPYKDYRNFKGIDLLPYHKMGVNKYNQLGVEYPVYDDPSLSNEDLNRIESYIKEYDLQAKVVRH